MITQQLRFCNVSVFLDEQIIDLPAEKESNVTVLALRNTVKSSVVRALKFLFCGYLSEPSFMEETD